MGAVNSTPVPEEFPLSSSRSSWMGEKIMGSPEFASLKLEQIIIPGTHNSATYYVEPSVISSIAQCQNHDVAKQLKSGVRWLDLRIADNTPGEVLMIAHRFLCTSLGEIFHQISSFLIQNPTEFVIVAIKKDWDRDLSVIGVEKLDKMIVNYFGKLISTKYEVDNLSIKELMERKRQIHFMFSDLDSRQISFSGMSQSWCTTNSSSMNDLVPKLNIFKHDGSTTFNVHDCYLTPDAESITKWSLRGINWHKLQHDANHGLLLWLRYKISSHHNFNILSFDMINQEIIDFIIDLNPNIHLLSKSV